MLHRETHLAHDFIDYVGGFLAHDFVGTRFSNQIDIFDVRVQLHPVGDWLLDASVNAGYGGGEFVTSHAELRTAILPASLGQPRAAPPNSDSKFSGRAISVLMGAVFQ